MKRLAFLFAGGALFLLFGALPVLADGGPHDMLANNGSTGVNKDTCAGCHRSHSAPAPMLLDEDESALCLTCHGSTGMGATTDVMNGIQYKVGQGRGGAVLGALRSGGFQKARIGSTNAGRLSYLRTATELSNDPFVPVLGTGQTVTSTHLNPAGSTAGTVWGSGATDSGKGASMTLECTSCHNPHGNGQYRILNPIPGDGTDGPFVEATTKALVDEVLDPPSPWVKGDPIPLRNYTVIQKYGSGTSSAGYMLYASDVTAWSSNSETAGDYFHRKVPWFGVSGTYTGLPAVASMNDAPNGKPSTFNGQINTWCSQCHTRYLATGTTPYKVDSGDDIFAYRHSNTSNKPCTTCHVAHGSNAVMTGLAAEQHQPGSTTQWGTNSLLLKIDNRGTCQACHNPTEGADGDYYPVAQPTPVVP